MSYYIELKIVLKVSTRNLIINWTRDCATADWWGWWIYYNLVGCVLFHQYGHSIQNPQEETAVWFWPGSHAHAVAAVLPAALHSQR